MILYRSVSLQELALMYDGGMKAFPTGLPQQPIFYPVLQLEYARQIASDWNANNGAFAGYVTQFKVEDEYIGRFEQHTVAGSAFQEFWIPAEELQEFNRQIMGLIKVIEAHFGDGFQGYVPEKFGLQGKDASAQFTLLANSFIYKRMDFYLEIRRNHKAVFLNYPFWQKYAFKNQGLKEKVIQAIKEAWFTSFPKIPLPSPPPVDVDTPPVEQIDAPADSSAEADEEDTMPKEGADAQTVSWADDEDEDIPIRTQTHVQTQSSADAAEDEDIAQEEQTDSNSWEDDIDKEIASEEQTEAQIVSRVHPVHEAVPPIMEVHSHTLVDPDDEETNPKAETGADAHFVQGVVLGLSGKYHEAIDELSSAVEEYPNYVNAHTSLGVAFHRLGDDERALSSYEAALRIDATHAEAHYFRANILYGQGNVRAAIAGYTTAIGLQPDLIDAHQKAIPQDRLTDYSPAPAEMHWIAKPARRILDLDQLLTTDPGQVQLLKERAAEYHRLGNYSQAITDYGSYLALQPDDADAFHLRGVTYEQLEQLDRASEDYQRAIDIDPRLPDVYINRGVAFGKMGQFRQSIASLTEAIRLAPQNPDGYFNRGTSYFQLGDLEHAIQDFSQVIQLSPEDEAAYYWRAIGKEEAGHTPEAIADYRMFLALSQDAHPRQEVEKKLSQLGAGGQERVPADAQKTGQGLSETMNPERDIHGLILALGERAVHSTWFATGVDCVGEKAEELYSLTDQEQAIIGQDLIRITAGIRQTIEGDFYGFEPDAAGPWIFIRAWDGSGFYIETNDPEIKERLKTHFPRAQEVEEASPSYEGLFIASDQLSKQS